MSRRGVFKVAKSNRDRGDVLLRRCRGGMRHLGLRCRVDKRGAADAEAIRSAPGKVAKCRDKSAVIIVSRVARGKAKRVQSGAEKRVVVDGRRCVRCQALKRFSWHRGANDWAASCLGVPRDDGLPVEPLGGASTA